jgi:hypothetical protein
MDQVINLQYKDKRKLQIKKNESKEYDVTFIDNFIIKLAGS